MKLIASVKNAYLQLKSKFDKTPSESPRKLSGSSPERGPVNANLIAPPPDQFRKDTKTILNEFNESPTKNNTSAPKAAEDPFIIKDKKSPTLVVTNKQSLDIGTPKTPLRYRRSAATQILGYLGEKPKDPNELKNRSSYKKQPTKERIIRSGSKERSWVPTPDTRPNPSQEQESAQLALIKQTPSKQQMYKARILEIEREKAKLENKMKSVLDKIGLKIPAQTTQEVNARINRLTELKENGLNIQKISLELEVRYENMLGVAYRMMQELKNSLSVIFDDNFKEIATSISNEMSQNRANFEALEFKLYEARQTAHENQTKRPDSSFPLEAFKQFFTFEQEFAEEFYGSIASRIQPMDIKVIQSEMSKYFSYRFNQSIVAPKSFATELIRFFENMQARHFLFDTINPEYGTAIVSNGPYPHALNLSKSERSYYLPLGKTQPQISKSRHGGAEDLKAEEQRTRRYSIQHWLDNKMLLVANQHFFRIYSTLEDGEIGYSKENSEDHEDKDRKSHQDDFEADHPHPAATLVFESPLYDDFFIHSVCSTFVDRKSQILLGGKNSVSNLS